VKKYLVVTIDVEPDCTESWQYSNPLTFHGVEEGIGNRLQPLFNRYNIKPTYLINNVVLEDQQSIGVFKKLLGSFELGTHLHPEFIQPQKAFDDYAGKKGEANCCFYEPEIEYGKIESITRLFEQCFNFAPTSFRAGRFSAGANTIKSLYQLGYKVDTSVTPNMYWKDRTRERPVDFREANEQPYFVNGQSIIKEDLNGPILEVPVTIVKKKDSLVEVIKKAIRHRSLPSSNHSSQWLRPIYSDTAQLEWVMKKVADSYVSQPVVVYNMMFHNVEVLPNLSPYTRTEEDCKSYLLVLEWLFKYCQREDICSVSLSDLYDIYKKR
jgi:hypothetical protein